MVTPCFEYYSRLMSLKLFGFPGVKGWGREGEPARKLKLHHLVELDRITVMRMHIGRNSKWRRKCRRTTNILGLQPRDKTAMLGVKTKEYFLEEFT